MPIEVELPDGSIAEFPDGTSNSTMEMALSRYRQTKSGPNFGNVQTTIGGTEQARMPRKPAPKRTAAQLTGISDEMMNPAYQAPAGIGTKLLRTVMPLADPNFRAGIGKSFADSYQGLKQLGTEGMMLQTGLTAGLMNRVGLDGNSLIRNQGFPLQDARNQQMQDTTKAREDDAPLMGTTSGLLGNATGTAAQFLGPGMALRGTTAARAFLPATIGGNAAQGGVLGAIQPYSSEGDRMANTALGAGFGAAGAALPAVIGAGWRAATRPATTGAERRAGTVFKDALQGENLNYVSSEVPGVMRSLGEGTLNPQIMAIERNARRDFPGMFEPNDLSNNAARTDILRGIAGDEQAMADAMAARTASTGLLRNQAFSEGDQVLSQRAAQAKAQQDAIAAAEAEANRFRMFGVEAPTAAIPPGPAPGPKASLAAAMARLAEGQAGRSTVRDPINYVSRNIAEAPETMSGLYNVRKTVTDLLEGKGGTETQSARAATKELMQARGLVDAELSGVAPSWDSYIKESQRASAPINRMQVGEELLRRANPSGIADALGNPQIAPSSFSRSMTVLDRIAGKATGFKKGKAESILTPDDMKNLLAINDDVRRISIRQTNKAQPGSATSESAALRNKILQRTANMALPGPVGGFVNEFAQNQIRGANQATMEKIAYLAANPAEAMRVLSALKGRERSALESALIAIGGRSGAVGSTLTE